MKRMTWAELKAAIERNGVTDDDIVMISLAGGSWQKDTCYVTREREYPHYVDNNTMVANITI